MKKTGTMDEGWNAEIRRAVAEARKKAAGTKAEKSGDPKKKKAAIEAELKKIESAYKAKKTK